MVRGVGDLHGGVSGERLEELPRRPRERAARGREVHHEAKGTGGPPSARRGRRSSANVRRGRQGRRVRSRRRALSARRRSARRSRRGEGSRSRGRLRSSRGARRPREDRAGERVLRVGRRGREGDSLSPLIAGYKTPELRGQCSSILGRGRSLFEVRAILPRGPLGSLPPHRHAAADLGLVVEGCEPRQARRHPSLAGGLQHGARPSRARSRPPSRRRS